MSIQNNFPAIKPTLMLDFANTKALDPRVTFTRASTATFYNGVTTAKAEENLLFFSQEFNEGGWGKTQTTVSTNTATAPDGTSTAETLIENTATAVHFCFQNVAITTGLPYVFSVFLKKGSGATAPDWMQLTFKSATFSNAYVNFNINTGTVGTTSGATASIINAGNGWYRCTVTVTSVATDSASNVQIVFTNNNDGLGRAPSYAGATTSDVLLWGAQMEQRSAVSAYTATTPNPITNYIPVLQTAASGVARFEHNPVTGESLGLEIEEQRTNLLTYSEEFDNAAWTKAQSSITANTIVSPAGTLTGDKLVENTATADHAFRGDATISAGATISFSIYAKAAERTNIRLQFADTASTNQTLAFFNLSDGTTSGLSQTGSSTLGAASVTAVGNGWYRCVLTGRIDGSATTARCRVSLADASSNISYTGNGFAGAFIWGAQLEAGAFATSYIPTVASQVTRAADAASMTGANFSSWYNQAQGTVYVNASGPAARVGVQTLLRMTDGTANNVISGFLASDGTRIQVVNGGVLQADQYNLAVSGTSEFKYAFGYAVNNITGALNSLISDTDSSAIIPATNNLQIGSRGSAADFLNGTIRKIAYYPLRVTNAQLQALTS